MWPITPEFFSLYACYIVYLKCLDFPVFNCSAKNHIVTFFKILEELSLLLRVWTNDKDNLIKYL